MVTLENILVEAQQKNCIISLKIHTLLCTYCAFLDFKPSHQLQMM